MRSEDRLEIRLRDVSVRRGGKWVLRDVSLTLKPGERWALIGANGAGKTQLLKVLAADVWPTPTGREELRYSGGGRLIEAIDAKPRIAYVGAERQDKYARYGWNPSVRDLIATGLHGTDLLLSAVSAAEQSRVRATLRSCGLAHLAAREFLTLSYGQQRLALLARALASRPDWLLLDEFYNGLDTTYRHRIDAILRAARRRGASWVAAAHRPLDVPRGTSKLVELRAGRVCSVEALSSAALRRLGAAPSALRIKRTPTAGAAAGPPARVLIRLVDADLYVDYRPVLRHIDWQLRSGEHCAVLGANGAGKSSFLKLLYGDLSPALGGRIERRGFPAGTPIEDWKRSVGYVSPELQADYRIDVSVFDLVASGRYSSIGLADPPTAADRKSAARWLAFFELTDAAALRPRELSYGQLRRALIARAMAAEPRLLLLDEPLTGLDPGQRVAVKRLLERLMARAVSIVIAVHHAEDLPRGISRGLRLHKRRAIPISFHNAN